MNFDGKHLVITGGGRGLGFAFAQRAVTLGASVSLIGRDEQVLKAAVAQLAEGGAQASGHVGDVSRADDVSRVVSEVMNRFGKIDGAINNAGIADEASFLDITEEGWRKVVDVNLNGPFFVTQTIARSMTKGGAIVNIASVDAWGADGPYASYVAAKSGLIGLTKAAATELGQFGIRVNSVSPGWAMTDMAEESVTPEVLHRMKTDFRRAPLGRVVETEEVANAVLFLLSSAASGITGVDLPVDGGILANLYILETLDG